MSDSKRLLAPAPPGVTTANDSQQRRKNVGTACLACKTRKLKCTGVVPCANCIKSRLECTLDYTADKRRRGALKRKIDQLEEKEDLLIRLVDVLRESGNSRTGPLINLIRSNASLAEIRYYLDHKLPRSELEQTPELAEVCHEIQHVQQAESRSIRRILDAKRLSDIPQYQVPARPWTNVVEDNDFVSHLVSLWFTWSHPFSNWLGRDRFVKDMQAGSLNARFCSPFLVNIILAEACTYSDYPEAYAVPDDVASKGAHFYDEAKRLLDKEEGRITLPTVQGLGILWACASMTGRDRQGWIYRSQLAYAVQELAQKHSFLASKADDDTLRTVRVIHNTLWGLFNISTMHALSEKKTPLIRPPQRQSLPPVEHESGHDEWVPYPTQSEGRKAHIDCVFNALCSLNLIAYDAANHLFKSNTDRSRSESEKTTSDFHNRLREWAGRLPSCLAEKNNDTPHVLCLHMYYHTILMTIYAPLKIQANNADPKPIEITPFDARNVCLASARAVAGLIRIHQKQWGLDRMPVRNIQWVAAALFTLLDDLEQPDNRAAFISLTVSAKALSRRWGSCKLILQAVEATAHDSKTFLPTETDPLFAELDTNHRPPPHVPSDEAFLARLDD
ncbi:hypothetical protein BDV59DRAFT_175146 [Aspergillus ambiguus]|uniref:putative C6 transcription factor n=1 Tax=Aspergillus ambiguus TaxID=176160 RepID=UPI003CCD9B72